MKTAWQTCKVSIVVAEILCLLMMSDETVSAQRLQPIDKDGLLTALNKKVLSAAELKIEIDLRGVAFPITPESEAEIRRRGNYLGSEIEKLLEVLRNNYRPPERLRLSLLKYAPCEKYFEEFASLLHSKINILPSMLIRKDHRSSYTAGLTLVKEERISSMSLNEANEYWKRTQSLQVLQGICAPKGNEVYVISLVFLGDLHGGLANTVRIEFKVDPNEYGSTRDIHSLLILYSLAKEGQARGLSKDLIIAYLSEALGIARQIKHGDMSALESIKAAVLRMLSDLGASDLTLVSSRQE